MGVPSPCPALHTRPARVGAVSCLSGTYTFPAWSLRELSLWTSPHPACRNEWQGHCPQILLAETETSGGFCPGHSALSPAARLCCAPRLRQSPRGRGDHAVWRFISGAPLRTIGGAPRWGACRCCSRGPRASAWVTRVSPDPADSNGVSTQAAVRVAGTSPWPGLGKCEGLCSCSPAAMAQPQPPSCRGRSSPALGDGATVPWPRDPAAQGPRRAGLGLAQVLLPLG